MVIGSRPAISGPVITAGTIDTIEFRNFAITQITLFNLALSASAVKNLLLPLGWTLNGNANADILLAGATSSNGVALNLSGNDTFNLNGGNDQGIGGTGGDTIDGGIGSDRLTGNAGRDRLIGGAGRDAFVFNLGDGSDQISQFDPKRDRIDLAPGLTHSFVNIGGDLAIDYGPGNGILLLGVDFADAGLILIV